MRSYKRLRHIRHFALFLIFSATLSITGTAQTNLDSDNENQYLFHYHHQKWTMEDGFPAEEVRDIDQDSLGYIWLATDLGVLRFDGHRFEQFNLSNTAAFQNDFFKAVEVSSSGKVWVGNLAGLYYYDDGFKYWTDSEGNSIEDVEIFVIDNKDRLWIRKKNQLFLIENNKLRLFDTRNYQIQKIFKGAGNKMWISCLGAEFLEIHDTTIVKVHSIDQFITEQIGSLQEDSLGGLYLGISNSGLHYYKDGKVESPAPDLNGKNISDLLIDQSGYLWAGSRGILRFYDGGYETFSENSGLTDFGVTKLFNDRNGNIWAGTKKGLNLFYRDKVKNVFILKPHGYGTPSVSSFAEDETGEIFVGTYGEGIWFYRDGKIMEPLNNRMLAGQVIYGMYSRGDNIAVSSNDGAYLISQDEGKLQIERKRSPSIVWSHFFTSDSTLWINYFTNMHQPRLVFEKNGKPQELKSQRTNRVFWYHENPDGGIMMGTKEGLLLWNGQELIDLSEKLNIPFKQFSSHAYDQDRDIHWMGTDGSGLIKYQNRSVSHLTTKNGFPTNIVRNLHLDKQGGLWVIGHSKAYYFNSIKLAEESFPLFFKEEKLYKNVSANGYPVSYQIQNGNILIANRRGLIELNTDYSHSIETPLLIKTVISDEDTVNHKDYFEIPSFSRRLTIHYSAIDFIKGDELLFEYRLSDYEENWNQAGFERTATYTSLPAGDYQCELRKAHTDGTYQYLEDQVIFSKAQKWYYSWYAILVYGVLFILLVRAIIMLRTRRIKQKNIDLQKKIDERTEELRDLNATLEQKVVERTHEVTQINKELSESEERYSYALDASNDGIWDYDVQSDSIKYSPAIYTMLGFSPYEFDESRDSIYKLIHPEDQQKWHTDYHEEIIKGDLGSQFQDEYRIYSKKKELLWVSVKGKIVEWTEEKNPKRIVGTHTDITVEKRKNQEILEAVLKTEDAERNRISKFIHDGLQQKLVISSLNFQQAKKELKELSETARKKFETGWKYLQDSISESRAVAHSLMPKEIIDFGLIGACEDLIIELDKASETTDFNFQHNFTVGKLDSQQIEITLYRIIQECTTNIVKYAKATRVEIQLREYDDIYSMTIEDNGIGFDVEKVRAKNKGMGLNSMQNRLDAINGFLEISSRPGKGTAILVEINKIL